MLDRNGRHAPPIRLAAGLVLCAALLLFAAPASFARGPESVADIAEGLQETVVNISSSQTVKGIQEEPGVPAPKGSPFEEFFDDFFDSPEGDGPPRRVSSLGSGFVYDSSGLIVTNNHVIEGADEIIVNFTDGRKLKVTKVLGHDPKTDLALLKVEPEEPLKAVKFGDSSKMRVGDWVMAIGNPFGLGGTVTVGIISATRRDINAGPYDDFIQTDAAINRGNSGGPLFNMDGEVIGVNTAIISPTGGSIGIGFAVPSTTAEQVIAQLKEYGETRRGWLGVHVQNVTDEIAESLGLDDTKGALVAKVMAGSPAEAAEIKSGDVILSFDGQEVDTMRSLPRVVASTPIDKTVEVTLLRNKKVMTVPVTVGRLPESEEVTDLSAQNKELPAPETDIPLGLRVSPLTDGLREQFEIDDDVEGVIITAVDPASQAAEKGVKPGDVIVEVTQEKVTDPDEILARIDAVKKSGRKSVLLLISDGKGELSFVALSLQ
ncbi:DegQ family serine endoprotease [Methyloligella sp. 2.7D]|uniref:DegQ family serine endoprotease n=1 Tax=unclassified Methyloligella TaxID=2625955 RepID=UPI00157C925B|nr:DegQ family serine endoprotease [Methyloligella sp. GL2]QKP77962.1 DegQ family serine endoprotease [Methyloligella sp. GL2]